MVKHQGSRQPRNAKPFKSLSTKIVAGNIFNRKFLRPALGLVILMFLGGVALANSSSPTAQTLISPEPQAEAKIETTQTTISEQTAGGSVRTEVKSRTSDSGNGADSSASVEIKVNGEEVPINPSGPTDTTIKTEDGEASIDVDIRGDDVSSSVRYRVNGSTHRWESP